MLMYSKQLIQTVKLWAVSHYLANLKDLSDHVEAIQRGSPAAATEKKEFTKVLTDANTRDHGSV